MSDTVLISEPQARLIYTLHREVGYAIGEPIPPTVAPHESANLNALANLGLLETIDPFIPSYALTPAALHAYDAWARTETALRVISPSLQGGGRVGEANSGVGKQQQTAELNALLNAAEKGKIAAQNRAANYRACILEITKIIQSSPLPFRGGAGGEVIDPVLTEIYLLCEHHLDLIDSILESDPLPAEGL